MDSTTVQYYSDHAALQVQRYSAVESPALRHFAVAFSSGSRVLDVGCGSGRDLNALLKGGYDASGVDPCPEMLREAARVHPMVAGRSSVDKLPDLATVPAGAVDGVLCEAVLMHVPEEHLFDTVFNLRRVLKAGGRLLISTPLAGPPVDPATRRDADGRLFNGVTPENFHFLLQKLGFQRLGRWDAADSLGRTERSWATQLFVLAGEGSRSLDTIEAILNRDKKDATYKPALFRALADLATKSYHSASWLPGGRVAIPMRLIADKWLEYYWPLFESATFIPQKRGEKRDCQKPVAFRASLESLIGLYRNRGGLSGFTVDYRSRGLAPQALALHAKAVSTICSTIRAGPVYFAGGGGSGTFRYSPSTRCVEMSADLWRELSVMANWVADATVLRWAELTVEISRGTPEPLQPSQVIDALLTAPLAERDVQAARRLYADLDGKVCVWTDRNLSEAFDVDHAIPFALWRNNDLWNLLPASTAANQHKRDRLPSRSLLRSRRSCILGYWSRMREAHPVRFDFEVERLAGQVSARGGDCGHRFFGVVAEAVEFTALQRGVERWEPRGFRVVVTVPEIPVRTASDAPGPAVGNARPQVISDPPEEERFITWVPYYDLAAAAGGFGPEQPVPDPSTAPTWIRIEGRRLTSDMFAIRVIGRSMEPKIPDGAICLFRGGDALAGSRQGRILLVALRDSVDPETGGRLTVKRYASTKAFDDEGAFRHVRIELQPINPDFRPILVQAADDGALRVLGEWLAVVR